MSIIDKILFQGHQKIESEKRFRTRALLFAILSMVAIYTTTMTYGLWIGRPVYLPLVIFNYVVLLSLIPIIRFSQRIDLLGNLFMALIILTVGWISLRRGGIDTPGMIWICILPVFGGLFLSFSWAITWSVVLALGAGALFIFQSAGLLPPSTMTPEELRPLKLMAFVFVQIFGSGILAYSYRQRSRYQLQIEKEKNETATLLRVLCHDLNPSLEVISRFVNNAFHEDGTVDTTGATTAKMAVTSIREIVNQARDWQKTGENQGLENLAPVSVHSIVHALYSKFILQLEVKKIRFEFQKGSGMGMSVLADPLALIQQIFGNLMSNAIKFTPSGGKIIFRAVKRGDEVHLILADTGMGMPNAKEIFKPHQSAHSRVGTGGEMGTGFGLSIIDCYVKRLGGRIQFRSSEYGHGKKNHGTVVRVALKSTSQPAPRKPEQIQAFFLKVLVVDDSKIYHELACDYLTEMHCICMTAFDSASAMQALKAEKFDAIFMDAHLASESGYLLAKQMRAGTSLGNAKIFFFSAAAPSTDDRPLSFEQVFDGYVLKPLDAIQLQSVLEPLGDLLPEVDSAFFEKLGNLPGSGEKSLFNSLSRTFIDMVPNYVQQLNEAIRIGDVELANALIQKIKSNSENLGFVKLARIAQFLENNPIDSVKNLEWISAQIQQELVVALEFLHSKQIIDPTIRLAEEVEKP